MDLESCSSIISTAATLMIMSFEILQSVQRLQERVEHQVSVALQIGLQPPLFLQQPLSLHQPLSLQEASTLYVISNLERFPPDMLALLPLRFRRDLLLMLPPADIFQLEQTSVVNGIDMEKEIWKVLYYRYDYQIACTGRIDPFTGHNDPDELAIKGIPQFPEAIKKISNSAPFAWKASFLSWIFTLLLHMRPFQIDIGDLKRIYKFPGERNYIVFLQLLFCTRFFTLKQIHSLRGFPLQVFRITLHLSRHHQLIFPRNEPLQVTDWIHFLLVKCQLEAPCSITVDEPYFERDVATFDRHPMDRHKLNSVLRKLFLHPLLSLQKSPTVSHQFHTLKHVHITGFNPVIGMSTFCSLLVLIQNQVLETIFVSRLHIEDDEAQQASLQQALEKCFSSPISPTCTSITLDNISEFPFFSLLWLIQKFLYSTSNDQILTVTNCGISYSIVPELKCTPAPSYLALFHKSLHISNLNIEPAFIKALSCLPSAVLDSLQLNGCWNSEVKLMDFFDALFISDSLCKIKRIFYQMKANYDDLYECRSYIASLGQEDLMQIEALFTFAQQFPETAISLHYETTSYVVGAFFHCLQTKWKKNGGRKLDRLIITFIDDPWSSRFVESYISACSINMLAKSVEVHHEEHGGICWID